MRLCLPVNEEMLFVLDGEALRFACQQYPICGGDFICSPAYPAQPEQIISTSVKELACIAFGTMEHIDVYWYPHSGKSRVWSAKFLDRGASESFVLFWRRESSVDYRDGETN